MVMRISSRQWAPSSSSAKTNQASRIEYFPQETRRIRCNISHQVNLQQISIAINNRLKSRNLQEDNLPQDKNFASSAKAVTFQLFKKRSKRLGPRGEQTWSQLAKCGRAHLWKWWAKLSQILIRILIIKCSWVRDQNGIKINQRKTYCLGWKRCLCFQYRDETRHNRGVVQEEQW